MPCKIKPQVSFCKANFNSRRPLQLIESGTSTLFSEQRDLKARQLERIGVLAGALGGL